MSLLLTLLLSSFFFLFFFNDTAPTEIYTLSLHDALSDLMEESALSGSLSDSVWGQCVFCRHVQAGAKCPQTEDRKSTRLNSSHMSISYAVFCLKKKKKKNTTISI